MHELLDSVAIVLNGISLDAWNNHQDFKTAVDANALATTNARSPELINRLKENHADLKKFAEKKEATKQAEWKDTILGWVIVIVVFIIISFMDSCKTTHR